MHVYYVLYIIDYNYIYIHTIIHIYIYIHTIIHIYILRWIWMYTNEVPKQAWLHAICSFWHCSRRCSTRTPLLVCQPGRLVHWSGLGGEGFRQKMASMANCVQSRWLWLILDNDGHLCTIMDTYGQFWIVLWWIISIVGIRWFSPFVSRWSTHNNAMLGYSTIKMPGPSWAIATWPVMACGTPPGSRKVQHPGSLCRLDGARDAWMTRDSAIREVVFSKWWDRKCLWIDNWKSFTSKLCVWVCPRGRAFS